MLLAAGVTVYAAPPQTLADCQVIYERQLAEINTNRAASAAAAIADYVRVLEALEQEQRRQGNLEAILALREEQKRLSTDASVPPHAPPRQDPVLARAQAACRDSLAAIETTRVRQMALLTRAYSSALKNLVKALVSEDRVPDAIAANTELKRVEEILLQFASSPALAPRGPATVTTPSGALETARTGSVDRRLVLWHLFESEMDVKRGRVGPPGTFRAGRFVAGRFGQGIELDMKQSFGVSFPADILPRDAGCIEFWAKLVGFGSGLSSGPRPTLISIAVDGNPSEFFSFNANDGGGNGGLTIRMAGFGAGGTGAWGGWTYERAIGSENLSEWHHYALVWDRQGIPAVQGGDRNMAIFVDGALNTQVWSPAAKPKGLRYAGKAEIGLLWNGARNDGSVVYDNLKIWNYAKTDFGDRDLE